MNPGITGSRKLFCTEVIRPIEQTAVLGSVFAMAALGLDAFGHTVLSGRSFIPDDVRLSSVAAGVFAMVGVSVFYVLIAKRWAARWPVYAAELALTGSYGYYRAFVAVNYFIDVALLAVFCTVLFGISELLENRNLELFSPAPLNFSIILAAGAPLVALARGQLDDLNVSLISFAALFFSAVCYQEQWKRAGYAAGVLYNVVLWMIWARAGLRVADHPQFYLVPAGLSAILYAEANRRDFRTQDVNTFRTLGSLMIALSTAVPMWEFQSFWTWLFLLLASLAGVFTGIALRVQTFVWMGMVFFVFDVSYQLGRVGTEYALAKWAIMVGLGILLLIFVALNEKKQIGIKMRQAFLEVRQWE